MRYEYLEAVISDVRGYIERTIDLTDWTNDRNGLEETLNDDLWTSDLVTGNGSGAYFPTTWKSEEALLHNWDIIEEVASAFDIEPIMTSNYDHGPDWWDVTIRCYYLGQAISTVLDELESDGAFDESDESE